MRIHKAAEKKPLGITEKSLQGTIEKGLIDNEKLARNIEEYTRKTQEILKLIGQYHAESQNKSEPESLKRVEERPKDSFTDSK